MNIKIRNSFWIGLVYGLISLTSQLGFTQNRVSIQVYFHEYGDSRQMWLSGDNAKKIFDILSLGSPRTENPRDANLIAHYTGVNIQCEQGFNALKQIAYSCFSRLFWSEPSGSDEKITGKPDYIYEGQFSTQIGSRETVEVKLIGNVSYHVVGFTCSQPQERNECKFTVDTKGKIKVLRSGERFQYSI